MLFRAFRFAPFLCLLAAAPAVAAASASLTGQVRDEQGHSVAKARVTLFNQVTGHRQTALTDAKGSFAFPNVPFNDYHLEATAPGFNLWHQDVKLRSTLPAHLNVMLASLGATVAVTEQLGLVEAHPSAHLDIDKSAIELAPAAVQSRAMESILLATPGFTQNENGRFHFRGSHGQVMFVVDGIPVTDQINTTFSNSLDPSQVEGMEVITGGIAAEYGGKPVAVVNMTTQSGLGTSGGFEGSVSLGAARFSTLESSLSVRGGTERFGYFVTGAASQSDRFLDVVSFDNFNNHGSTGRVSSRFDWVLSDQDTLRLSLSGGDTHRRVMNLASQQARGQDQKVVTSDLNLSVAWSHLFSANQSLETSAFLRRSLAKLNPTHDLAPGFAEGGPDYPYWAKQNRSLENQGLQIHFTQRFGTDHAFKTGLQYTAFPLREEFYFAVTEDGLMGIDDPLYAYTPAGGGHIWHFADHLTPRLASAFAQTDLHVGSWFLALGLRYDHYQVKDIHQSQLQPRLGVSYRLSEWGTVVRASYDRLMILRENENLALSLSQEAWNLGPYAGTPVPPLRPELQDSFSLGVEQQFGEHLRATAEYWEKRSRNAADSGQFLNTGITFPVGMTAGRFHGWNLRLDAVAMGGFSGYLSLGTTRARVQAPMVGGLQLEPPEAAPGQWFLIDHDQKLAGQLGLRYAWNGYHAQAIGRYDSGLVGGDPADQAGNPDYAFGLPYIHQDSEGTWRSKSRTVWNFSAGKTFPLRGAHRLSVGADLLNAFDKKALYTYLSGCGGTHVIPPRTWAVHLKYGF